ncbi:fasciclin domain-containing protein [Pseudoroseicyclus sp. CXY001]|uniref:fasciclin domain-containing protein n=1 Tax=Pseudoroseicyclus sp. CXY001 TaxID=3242492 RepID=UPI003570B3D0
MIRTTVTALALATAATGVSAQENPMVGGAPMMADMNIVENAMNSPVNTVLVGLVQAAGLAETLMGPGPYTVFAPTDEAFAPIGQATVDELLLPENQETLSNILLCHVVSGEVMSDMLEEMIEDDDGEYEIKTLGTCILTATYENGAFELMDQNNTVANIEIADVRQSNGVIHVIDAVMMPAM